MANPTTWWFCPKPAAPSGGVWFIHRLAALLAGSGTASRVIQTEPFEVWWDAHPIDSALIAGPRPVVEAGDTLILPEGLWTPGARDAFPGARVILFLQNYIWLDDEKRAALRRGGAEILVCSRYLANWVRRELGLSVIGVVNPYLDEDVWTNRPDNAPLIFARRNPDRAAALARALTEARQEPMTVYSPLTQREVGEALNGSSVLVHHVEPEGFPMAALEAMRSGVPVVGTTGGGGNEFMFNDETALVLPGPEMGHWPAEAFVAGVVERVERLRRDGDLRAKLAGQAYEWSLRYTAAATTHQLLKALA